MKKIILLLLSSFILTSCSNEVKWWLGQKEKDGLIYLVQAGGTIVIRFTSDLQEEEIIYIPPFLATYWSGEPMPVVIGGSIWLGANIQSDTARMLYLTGNQTSFADRWHANIRNLEMVAFNTLNPTYFAYTFPNTTVHDVIEYGYFDLYSHESYDSVVLHYDTIWNHNYGPQDWDPPVSILTSRVSYYYNYEDSPNEGLYRIGLEYEVGMDLTPPDDPTRIKKKNIFVTDYYSFVGWSSDATTFIPYDFENSEDEIDVQLYAHWE